MPISISRNGEEIGTWTEAEVRQLYQEGQLVSTDYYWREGMTQWDPLESLLAQPVSSASLPPVPAALSDAAPRPSRLSWLLPVVLAGFASILIGPFNPAEDGPARVGACTGNAIFLLIVAFPLSYIFRRSWRLAVRCGIIVGLTVLVLVGKQQGPASRISAEMNNFAAQQRSDATQHMTNGYLHVDPNKVDAEITKLKVMSQDENGSGKKMTDVALEMMTEVATHVKDCRDVEGRMLALDLSPAKITSLDELQKRRDAIDACRQPIQDLRDFLQNIDARARDLLGNQKVPQPEIDGFISGLHKTGKLEALASFWRLESTILTDLSDRLDLLKANWGKWHMQGDALAFDDSGALAAYQANGKKLHDDVAQQQAAQKQALGVPASK